jgi:hypothetical protein
MLRVSLFLLKYCYHVLDNTRSPPLITPTCEPTHGWNCLQAVCTAVLRMRIYHVFLSET